MSTPLQRPQGLARAQSLMLLGPEGMGRVAITRSALPSIIPVYYRVGWSSILFRAVDGLLASAAHGGHVACFQSDEPSPAGTPSWSVQIIGKMEAAPAQDWPEGNFDWCNGIAVQMSADIVVGHTYT